VQCISKLVEHWRCRKCLYVSTFFWLSDYQCCEIKCHLRLQEGKVRGPWGVGILHYTFAKSPKLVNAVLLTIQGKPRLSHVIVAHYLLDFSSSSFVNSSSHQNIQETQVKEKNNGKCQPFYVLCYFSVDLWCAFVWTQNTQQELVLILLGALPNKWLETLED
jgi:hypothetical protein